MPWPMSQDYNEAIQEPASSFTDFDLRHGEAVVNAMGLPVPCSWRPPRAVRHHCAAGRIEPPPFQFCGRSAARD